MPKAKGPAKPKLPPSDIAPDERTAFLQDLENHDPSAAEIETPPIPVSGEDEDGMHQPEERTNDVGQDEGRKITVKAEPAQTRTQHIKSTVAPDDEPESVDGDRTVPPTNMRTMQKAKRRRWPWGWTIAGLSVLAAAALTGWFVFNRAQRFAGADVKLDLSTATEVASGSTTTLTIRYINQEPVDLVQAELNIDYPDGFTFTQASQPSTTNFNNSFSLGTIKSGHVGSLTISGVIVGSVGDERTFNATLSYRPANFNSEFQTNGTVKVNITSSILEVKLTGPTQLAPNATGTWTITYRNTSDQDLAHVQIEAVYPEGLTVTKTDPVAVERSAVWRFDSIAQNADGKITITGTASGSIGDSLELDIKAGITNDTGGVDAQAEQSLLIILVNTGVQASIAVNGLAENSVIEAGDDLAYAVQVANHSDSEISDLTVATTLTGTAVDLAQLDNPSKAVVQNQTLTWTKKEVPALALLKPDDAVTLHFTVGSKASLTVTTDSDVNPQITAAVTITSATLPATNTNSSPVPAATLVTKISTVLGFSASARYYDDNGQALGTGPIPPIVGETTSYRIFWSLTNTTSDAVNTTVTTTLPTSVFWTGKNISRDAGDIAFDSTTRVVTWTINKVPAGTGSRLPKLNASFELSITPTSDQVGTVVVLTGAGTAKATDGFSTKALEVTQPSLTTELSNDPKGTGQGQVESSSG